MADEEKTEKPKNKEENQTGQFSEAAGPPNARKGICLLLQLPQELRDEIYAHVFFSTRISSGRKLFGRRDRPRIVPIPNALALLRTCRRVHSEIGKSWLHQVLFSFEDPESMLNKLADLPVETLSQIRHVRVSGDSMLLSPYDHLNYRTPEVLESLPGLQLDRLTVIGSRSCYVRYDSLDRLVKLSNGWKELHFLSHSSTFLGYKAESSDDNPDETYFRAPQPATWQKVLEDRDGSASRPSVSIYRSTNPCLACPVVQADIRVPFVQTLAADQTLAAFSKTEDATLMAPAEREKGILVVMKRGRGVDYSVVVPPHNLPNGHLRTDMSGMTWKQFKTMLRERRLRRPVVGDDQVSVTVYDEFWPPSDSDDDEFWQPRDDSRGGPDQVDAYGHVDDYVWSPCYLGKA